ncbi:unnamed protein product [Lactuca saligna]|uniref:Uncharacterized protein n=1 Tax=Lactuca saligna TaxID=75948 RepID=A0AA36E7M5_LACSI|nr:unnamed protein product [Lactuca saligna]
MSVIEHIPDTLTIPKTWFRFVSKSHLIGLGETPPYYPGALRHVLPHAAHIYVNPDIPETTSLINLYKLSVIITDATNTISVVISETSCQKLLRSSLDKFISDNPLANGNILPRPSPTTKEKQKQC